MTTEPNPITSKPITPNASTNESTSSSHSITKQIGNFFGRKVNFINNYYFTYSETHSARLDQANTLWNTIENKNANGEKVVKREFRWINLISVFTVNVARLHAYYTQKPELKGKKWEIFMVVIKTDKIKTASKVNFVLSHIPVVSIVSNLFFSIFPHLASKDKK
jgi:hypothetical protein